MSTIDSMQSNSHTFIVAITNRSIINASDLSRQPYVQPLSNFDLIPSRNPTALIFIYPKPKYGDFNSMVTVIKTNLPEFLNHFFPFAGRRTTNAATGRPEVLCNNQGAELVEAQANIPLRELDFISTEKSVEVLILPFATETPLSLQVIRFTCGGFCVTWCSNHLLVDACSSIRLASTWSELVQTRSISRAPNFDRSRFRPRSPLRHGPLVDCSYTTCSPDGLSKLLSKEQFERSIYYVTAADVDRLQALASRGGRKATRTEAFSAHVWKVLAEVVGESDSACQMAWVVGGRRWLGEPYADDLERYIGNMHSFAAKEENVGKLKTSQLSDVANIVGNAIKEVANEDHFRDLIDWVECRGNDELMFHRAQLGFGSSAILISSCHNFTVETDFGFGRAAMTVLHSPGSETMPTGYMNLAPRSTGDGSWIVNAVLWPKVASALQANSLCALKPLKWEYVQEY